MRILYAAGPGDVYGTYQHWKRGTDDPSQVAITYSGQFFDVCRELGARAYVVTSYSRHGLITDAEFSFIGIPVPFAGARGLVWHLGQIWYGILLLLCALRFKADVAVVSTGTHWFMLRPMGWFGIKVVPSLHTMLWTQRRGRTLVRRLIEHMDAAVFGRRCLGILCLSHAIRRQVEELTEGRHRPLVPFAPQYRREWFQTIAPPDADRRPFRVLFAGRVEPEKGVFDLILIAKRFQTEGRSDIEFDICGDGSVLDELRARARREGLEAGFRCHGHCDRDAMRRMLEQSHATIVPTNSVIGEGMNKVVIESVLAGRPVVTSSICPAVEYVEPAVVLVPAEDAKGYGDALCRLCDDVEVYESKRRQCERVAEQFYDARCGWAAGFRHVLSTIARESMRSDRDSGTGRIHSMPRPLDAP